jgi:hypothetical protein
MKTRIVPLFMLLCVFTACKKPLTEKDPDFKPAEFKNTFYENACSWDATGKPDCLLAPDVISAGLLAFMNSNVQEGKDLRTTNPNLLSSSANADIAITQPSDVFITFVTQGTGAQNAFGYYTFPTNEPPKTPDDIKKITYIFPSVGLGSPLKAGDKVKLGRFNAGTSIGFVILYEGWNPGTKTINSKAIHFTSNDILNPEVDPKLKKHAVLINYSAENKILIGYEDSDRSKPTCDHDFNDVVLYATVQQ